MKLIYNRGVKKPTLKIGENTRGSCIIVTAALRDRDARAALAASECNEIKWLSSMKQVSTQQQTGDFGPVRAPAWPQTPAGGARLVPQPGQ